MSKALEPSTALVDLVKKHGGHVDESSMKPFLRPDDIPKEAWDAYWKACTELPSRIKKRISIEQLHAIAEGPLRAFAKALAEASHE